jgi:3'-5' exoribonuclease
MSRTSEDISSKDGHPVPRPLQVQSLVEGDAADGMVIVRKKVRREQPSGEIFLLFQLGDDSGQINAILWRGGEVVDRQLAPGDLAHVRGTVELYQNTRQIRIQRIDRADPDQYDVTAFLPTSPHDTQAQYERLLQILDTVQDPHLHELYGCIFRDPQVGAKFRSAPAGKGWHHAYVGGLLDHCLSMIEIGEVLVRQHPLLDRDLLVGGIVLHDIGKIEELLFRSYIDYTTPGRLVGHLVQGCLLVGRFIDRIEGFPEELRSRLLHMLVSHHGSLDRGSPREPMTLEATILHLLDHLDSQAEATSRIVGEIRTADGWSEHIRLINRSIYRGTRRST